VVGAGVWLRRRLQDAEEQERASGPVSFGSVSFLFPVQEDLTPDKTPERLMRQAERIVAAALGAFAARSGKAIVCCDLM